MVKQNRGPQIKQKKNNSGDMFYNDLMTLGVKLVCVLQELCAEM